MEHRLLTNFLSAEELQQLNKLCCSLENEHGWQPYAGSSSSLSEIIVEGLSESQIEHIVKKSTIELGGLLEVVKYESRFVKCNSITSTIDTSDQAGDTQLKHWRMLAVINAHDSNDIVELNISQPNITRRVQVAQSFVFPLECSCTTKYLVPNTVMWILDCWIRTECSTSQSKLMEIRRAVQERREAIIIGAGEVGKRLYAALIKSGWTCRLVTRHDTDGWKYATDLSTCDDVLRILCMREEDLGSALDRFSGFPHLQNIVLVQNGFLETIVSRTKLAQVTRLLIYFTSKGSFFHELTSSIAWGLHSILLTNALVEGGLNFTRVPTYVQFTKEMITKVIWNCIVGLPLNVHQCTLKVYLNDYQNEMNELIAEGLAVAKAEYGIAPDLQFVREKILETTQPLGWMERKGPAVGLATRNGAVEKWGAKHNIPTPVTSRLLQANAAL